jgi:hypothetical protein
MMPESRNPADGPQSVVSTAHNFGSARRQAYDPATRRSTAHLGSGNLGGMEDSKARALTPCRCEVVERLDGTDAEAYASEHLTLIERGRNNYEMYQCSSSGRSWIMDFPLGHWATDRRGRVRLRREPFDEAALPIGALDL